ncbi:hypothetical protein ACFJXH_13350 [Enterococcus faecalis]|nr:hypothetical protein [Enterococcus faecalis]
MAKAKKEEVQETKAAKKKPAVKEVEQPDDVEVTEEPVEAPQAIERQTPFGVEVWDPIEKRTVLKDA